MLWLRIFLLFLRTNLILLFGLITTLQATVAQISRDQFLHVLSNALEHDWEFEAYHSQLKAKVDFQKEFLKYDDLLDRLLLEKNHSP